MGTNSGKRRHCFSCVGFKREDVLDYDEDMAPTSTDCSSGQFSVLCLRRFDDDDDDLCCVVKERDSQKSNVACSFTFKELAAATQNFREANVIGEGGFGNVYKGRLDSGTVCMYIS